MKFARCLGFALMFSLAFTLPAWRADADGLATVSCDGFILGYNGQVESKICSSGDLPGARLEGTRSRIDISDPHFHLVVEYYATKFMTYLPFQDLRQLVWWDREFSKITNWQALPDSHGFRAASFSGLPNGKSDTVQCTIFARYTAMLNGHYEYPDGPGYRNLVRGIYCPRSTPSGTNAMASFESDLGKLQAPDQ